ncbi:MAG: NifB/NifX family molybdenum-iron cluster-binding protein [Desulfonatronovibrio sp.]
MKVAFSIWKKRISPVFDVSREICLMDIEDGKKIQEKFIKLPGDMDRCAWLVKEGVEALVCGAISSHLHSRLQWMRIRVFPFIAGDISQVTKAWLEDGLMVESFAMPGCCCRLGVSAHKNKEALSMKGRNQGQSCPRGQGQGQGSGMGQGRRRSRTDTTARGQGVAGNAGTCTCPKCGHQTPHQRGVPCMEQKCPECGEIMRGQV